MSYTFDGTAKTITITAQTVMSVRDVYSRWVDWVAGNAQYLPAFRTVGGDDIDLTAGTAVPIYAYLTNGWRIRPQESDHTLTVNDGVLLVDGGGDPFLDTLGDFTVRVNYQQPVQAITVATGGGGGATPSQVADAVWQRVVESGMSAEELLRIIMAGISGRTNGAGSAAESFLSVSGAKTRIQTGFDGAGNRATVTLDATP